MLIKDLFIISETGVLPDLSGKHAAGADRKGEEAMLNVCWAYLRPRMHLGRPIKAGHTNQKPRPLRQRTDKHCPL